uniref:SLBB domain-containing protein n=1 Tax=Candidatus Desulfatibia profunda TaxID=2841695 RepID=A0A8J6NPW2_9BACT|nr:SLBB domain-containing protein [Candidatus Desulfatibia profunda]
MKSKPKFYLPLLLYLLLLISPQQSRAQIKAYQIGARDVLTLVIYAGGEKQHEADLTVSSTGMINVPFIGPVKAEGLSTPQLEELILKPLSRDFFVNPEIHLHVKEYHSLQYYISGAVKDPGLYEMTSEATLMALIAKAGGALPERGNIAYILRESTEQMAKGENIQNLLALKEPLKVDLKNLLDKGDMSHNLMLQPGDVVYIPLGKALDLSQSKIYVEGEVKNPGIYEYQPGLTALNACIMAGGFDKFAAPNRARIIRKENGDQTVIKINLNAVKKGEIPDVELQPGDLVQIPETWL